MTEYKDFKEQQGLPEGWKWVRLGEVCKITTGEKDVNEGNPEGEYYFFTCSRIPTRSDNYSFDAEAILIAGNGEVGTIHYYNGKFEAYQRTYVLVEFVSVDVKYIYYYLSKFLTKHLNIEKIGTTIQYIKFGDLYNFFIYLPEKEFEQRKIAEILETVDNAIEKTEKIIEKYKRIKQGLMQDLLTKGIDENGNIRSEKTHKFKDSPLGRIPEEWEVVRLGEAFYIKAGGDIDKLSYSDTKDERFKYPIFSNTLENKGLYGYSDRFTYPENCITITGRGTLGYAIPRFEKFNAIIRVLVLIPKFEINIVFISEYINNKINFVVESTGVPQLTAPKVAEYYIPLPPLSEQQRIAEILTQIDQAIEKEEKYKEKLERLKQGLMQDLLTGKVRVNHLIEEGAENVST